MHWQLNQILYPVYNLGPGKRIGIWTQGCTLACKGCINKMLWSKHGGSSIPVLEVMNAILEVQDDYDGITISGGEPFQQYEQLITFAYLIKRYTHLNIYCFSGYTLAELEELYPDKLFLRYIDYLVDGRYEQASHDDQNVRGSENQRLYRFTEGEAQEMDAFFKTDKWSLHIDNELRVFMAGIPRPGELKRLEDSLRNAGVHQQFK